MPTRLARTLVDAIANHDRAALGSCFADDARFRALIPPGLRECQGAADTVDLIDSWFADSTELALDDVVIDEIGDRLHVAYRIRGVEEGEPYVVEQQLYCAVEHGLIARADLLCSGFRPPAAS